MSRTQPLVLDVWTPLDYKLEFEGGRGPIMPPQWVGEHKRRLNAYMLLQSFIDNASREWLHTSDRTKIEDRREFGDASLIVETIVAAVLGTDPQIRVDGAGETGDDDQPTNAVADQLQEWFDEWADDERPLLTVTEGEEDAVGLSDCVYVVSWDAAKGRPIVEEYDPGFYFPVLDEGMARDFPMKVHLAWEFEKLNPATNKMNTYVRRITWELVTLPDGATQSLPWNEGPVSITCLKTDATWLLGDLDGTVEDLKPANAVYAVNADGVEVRDLDLNIDFIPVVHLPNTVARKQHFGRSSLMTVLQLLDELQAADTDLALTARTTGFPPIGVKGQLERGSDGKTVATYGPGTVFDGEVNVVDTSSSLDALLKYIEHLMGRLSVNTRIPASILGRIDLSGNIAGITVTLSFGPLKSMVTKMRMVRDEKYPLLWKFVARLAMQAGQIANNTQLPAIRLDFGQYLPSDFQAIITYLAAAVEANIMSRQTAIEVLIQAGIPADDAEAELERVQHEDFEGARELAEALASEQEAADYLGRDVQPAPPTTTPPPPTPTLPGPEPSA